MEEKKVVRFQENEGVVEAITIDPQLEASFFLWDGCERGIEVMDFQYEGSTETI